MNQPLYKYASKYGLILAAIPTIYNCILFVSGLHLDYSYYGEGLGESYAKARLYLLPLLLFMAIYHYKKMTTAPLTLKKAIYLGLWIFLTAAVLVIVYNLIFRLLVVPDFSVKFYEINSVQIYDYLLEAHQELDRDYTQTDMANHIRTNGSLWIALSAYLVLNLVFTLFFSLVFGLILRTRKKVVARKHK